jgi:hypothetical protein
MFFRMMAKAANRFLPSVHQRVSPPLSLPSTMQGNLGP